MKKDNIIWGLLLILAAVCLIAGKLDLLGGINIWNLILSVVLVGLMIKNIFRINFYGIFFPMAFLAILYDKPLGIEVLTPWTVLIAAAFISFGLSLIFPKKRIYNHQFNNRNYHKPHDEHFERVVNEADPNHVKCNVHFSSEIKYINSNAFEGADISCSFGAAKIYFDNAILKSNQASIRLNTSFAGLELYIPSTWRVVNYTTTFMGAIEENGVGSTLPDAPEISLYGELSFSGVTIRYV